MEKVINEKYKELLNFIKENLEKGYNIYSNIDDINELIDIIVMWYRVKYPEELLIFLQNESTHRKTFFNKVKSTDIDLSMIENLSLNMGYYELMLRILRRLHSLVECWYKDGENKDWKEDVIFDIWRNDLKKSYFNKIENSINIKENNLNSGDLIDICIDKYDGHIHRINYGILKDLIEIDCLKIEDFDNRNNNKSIKFNVVRNIVLTHKFDLELRNKIFELVALKLLFSGSNIKTGYIRSKYFIKEFNKYVNKLNLSLFTIDNIINNLNNAKDFQHEVDFISWHIDNRVKDEKFLMEEFRISFKTLHFLRLKNVFKPEELSFLWVYDALNIPRDDKVAFANALDQYKKKQ